MNLAGSGPVPVALLGPSGPWGSVDRCLREHGTVLAHGTVRDWAPPGAGEPDPAADGAGRSAEVTGPAALRALLGEEWDRYAGMRRPAARRRFAASRVLLKHVAARALGVLPSDLELARQPGGRPYLRGCDQLDVSLSHTGDVVVVGLTDSAGIGVDVEPADREIGTPPQDRRMWTPAEARALAALSPARRQREMVRLWTLKEAYSKAIGQGMRMPFGAFGFAPGARRPRILAPDGTPARVGSWAFGTRVITGGYLIGWAVSGPARDVRPPAPLDDALVEAVTAADRW